MIIYWKENGKKIGEDPFKNSLYEKIEKSGVLLGTSYSSSSGYVQLTIAIANGRLITKHIYDCYHKEH